MPDYTGGQFPSLDDNPEREVAQRTEPETDGDWFRKVFTVHNRAHTVGLPEDHEVHQSNFIGTLQAALQQGLHPKEEPELESEEPHSFDPNHTCLTYRVRVVPAVADDEPHTTITPSYIHGGHDPMNSETNPNHPAEQFTGQTDERPPAEHADPVNPDSGEFVHTKPEDGEAKTAPATSAAQQQDKPGVHDAPANPPEPYMVESEPNQPKPQE